MRGKAKAWIALLLYTSLANVIAAHPVQAQDGNAVGGIVWPMFDELACALTMSTLPFCSHPSTSTLAIHNHQSHHDHTHLDAHEDKDGSHIEGNQGGWIYLIRHGEKFKDSDKAGLSARGIRRARCLRNVFGKRGHMIDFIMAQDFKPNGKRKRPYETVAPLAKLLDIPLDHTCDRDDEKCAAKMIQKHARRSENVLVVWEHKRLSDIAKRLGVTGLKYPEKRYDVIFKLRNGKVHAIYSEECNGLDEQWFHWHGKKKGKHGKGGQNGRLIDDESWATDVQEEL
ncbi:uncharacterized protein FA14DRAFT_159178 [Meira miltonrushii]|uniref:Phosphoglycerate mutase-like protein n=1 Tax=Meira miltonrushii TaxID=1280837 RepID=A0A316VKK1_9BASI|nr:uncharacterized protein FA14DRAFT_159178 [Meira miltonrushii]PWN36863.1 hypothetical protein FA14DRAFT_159178 [Meira miltonrushii]